MSERHPSRAVAPSRTGSTVRDGVRLAYRVYGEGATTVVLMPTWTIIDSRFWKAQVGFLARHYRVVTFDGRGSGRVGPTVRRGALHQRAVRRRHARRHGRHRHRPRGAGRAVLRVGVGGARRRRRTPSGCWACSCSRRRARSTVGRPERERPAPSDEHHRTADGLGQVQPALLARRAATTDFLDFFFRRMFSEPHSTKQIEDCIGWAGEIDPRTLVDATTGGSAAARWCARPIEPLCAEVRCPVTVVHGTADRVDAARRRGAPGRADRWVAGRCSRASATARCRAIRSGSTCSSATSWTGSARAASLPHLGGSAAAGPSGCSTCPRRSASGTPAATSPSPRAARSCTRTSRSTGSPSTRSPRCSRRAGERVHPASAHLASESAPHRARVRRARPARLPGDPPHGRDPGAQLHGLRRRRRARALRPRGGRRGLGRRLLPAREPGAEAVRVRVDDRLRRLAADARRRRAGGAADRRLQRGDARAAGPVRRGSATGRSSWANPTTSCPTASGPGLPIDPRLGRAALRLRRLRDRLRPRRGRPTARTLRTGLGYRPDERVVRRHRRRLRGRRAAAAAGARRRTPGSAAPSRTCGSSWSPGRGSTRARLPRRRGARVRGYVPDLYRHLAAARPRRRAGRADHAAWS